MATQIVPETFVPYILKQKAAKLRKASGDGRFWAPLDRRTMSLPQLILRSCYVPVELLLVDRMALLLDLWYVLLSQGHRMCADVLCRSALLLGILYLTFQAFPIIFGTVHGFAIQFVGMSFLGIGIGMVIGLLCQPLFNR